MPVLQHDSGRHLPMLNEYVSAKSGGRTLVHARTCTAVNMVVFCRLQECWRFDMYGPSLFSS